MIIGINETKESMAGTIASRVLHGIVLKAYGLIRDYKIGDSGELMVFTKDEDDNHGWGELDIRRTDIDYIEYADKNLWPFIKEFVIFSNMEDTINSITSTGSLISIVPFIDTEESVNIIGKRGGYIVNLDDYGEELIIDKIVKNVEEIYSEILFVEQSL